MLRRQPVTKQTIWVIDHRNGEHNDSRLSNLRFILREDDKKKKPGARRNLIQRLCNFCRYASIYRNTGRHTTIEHFLHAPRAQEEAVTQGPAMDAIL